VALLAVIAYSVPAYWIPNLEPRHDWHRFLFFIFVYFLTSLVFVALSVFLAVALPNEGV
jgi:ABC-2 type transporter